MADVSLSSYQEAARRIGTTVEEYERRRADQQQWCVKCGAWHPDVAFARGDRQRRARQCLKEFREPEPAGPAEEPAATDIAYLAGVIDSDGYVTAACNRYKVHRFVAASIGITGTRRQPHDLAASIFGGNVKGYAVKGAQPSRSTNYMWQRYGRGAVPVLEAVLPYLRVKREQAELALHLQELVNEEREMRTDEDPYPWMGPAYDPEPLLYELAAEIRDLNTRSTRSRL